MNFLFRSFRNRPNPNLRRSGRRDSEMTMTSDGRGVGPIGISCYPVAAKPLLLVPSTESRTPK